VSSASHFTGGNLVLLDVDAEIFSCHVKDCLDSSREISLKSCCITHILITINEVHMKDLVYLKAQHVIHHVN